MGKKEKKTEWRLKRVKNYLAKGWECRKPYYKKWRWWKEKKSELWFPFEYELDEICSMAIPDIKRWDSNVRHIKVDNVFDVFFVDGDIITL